MSLIIHLVRAAVMLTMLFAGVVVAAYGTFGLRPPDFYFHVASGIHAVLAIVLGGLIVLAIPTVSSATLRPEFRQRIGLRQVLVGLPGLLVAWTYIIAVVAPVLIGSHNERLLVYALGVEGIAAYTAVFISGWGLQSTNKTSGLRMASWGVILVSLVIVGSMSHQAGSFLLFFGYILLTVKRLAADWFNPGGTTESMRAHQMMLASMTLCIYFLIGMPLLLMFDKWEILPIFGAFYFAVMAVVEMTISAPLASGRASQ